ncbi:MAG: UbiA family prenyltransferase [Fibrobacteria bacterium]
MTGGFSPKAFRAYLAERFPPALNGLAIFLLYSCTLAAAQRMLGLGRSGWPAYLSGYLWVLGVFYHLRVLDDLKDRDNDVKAYPGRILSRGLLTYRQLAWTGAIAILAETVIAWGFGPKILVFHFLTLGYSLAMYKEFFVRDWLKRRLFLYGISHMLILACIDFTILQMSVPHAGLVRLPGFFLFAFLGFSMTFSLEVSRKIRVAAEERPEVDTYSKEIGIGPSMALVPAFQAAVMILAWLLRGYLVLPLWFHAATLGIWLMITGVFIAWGRALTEPHSRKLDKVASLFYLQFYISLLGILIWRK